MTDVPVHDPYAAAVRDELRALVEADGSTFGTTQEITVAAAQLRSPEEVDCILTVGLTPVVDGEPVRDTYDVVSWDDYADPPRVTVVP